MRLAPTSREALVIGEVIAVEGPTTETTWKLPLGANSKALRFSSMMKSEGQRFFFRLNAATTT